MLQRTMLISYSARSWFTLFGVQPSLAPQIENNSFAPPRFPSFPRLLGGGLAPLDPLVPVAIAPLAPLGLGS